MGWESFARLVVFTGHASEATGGRSGNTNSSRSFSTTAGSS